MPKREYKSTLSLTAGILLVTAAFGLVISTRLIQPMTEGYIGSGNVLEMQDSVPGKKINPQDAEYAAAIRAADAFEKQKQYEQCLAELEKALKIKPGIQSVRERAARIRVLIAESKKSGEEIKKYMASGDKYFAAKDYLNAKSAYQMALDQNPDHPEAKEKLQKTMELLRSQKAQNILFDVAIANADKLFQAGDYEKARTEYENAAKLIPGDPYPKNKINEIIKLEIDRKVKEDEYAKAIASADRYYATKNYQLALIDYKKALSVKPEEKHPQQRIKELTELIAAQKAKDDAYNKAIALADQNFRELQYEPALNSYKEALTIKPEQVYPKNRIAEIGRLLDRITRAQRDYDNYITLADSLYIEKKYFDARENYLAAKSIRPGESYPVEMIAKADKMLTGQEAAMAKALEEKYTRIIAGADKLLAEKSYEPARAEYLKAGNLKPGESYPKEKVQAIDDILAAALKDKDEQYKAAIANGEKALGNKSYEIAKAEFNQALLIKPQESYPKTKIAEIDKLIANEALRKAEDAKYTHAIASGDSLFYEKQFAGARREFEAALKMKPTEAYPRNRLADIDAALKEIEKMKAIENQYAALIVKADKAFSEKNYEQSRADYSRAKGLKPEETWPKERLAEIDRLLEGITAAKALEENYRKIIAGADQLMTSKEYLRARSEYQQAATLKPDEKYPPSRIADIDKILAEQTARLTSDQNYRAAVQRGDSLMALSDYPGARTEFQQAIAIKPGEKYPAGKIAEIDGILAMQARQKALENDYTTAVTEADRLLSEKAYPEAKGKYQLALKLKPAEKYPAGKITEIDAILADIARLKSIDDQYAAAVKKADGLFDQKNYTGAKNEFTTALNLKPAESYPKERIARIDGLLAEIAAAKDLDDQYRATIGRADQFLKAANYNEARTEFGKALDLKPSEAYPKSRIAEIDKILADMEAKRLLDENYSRLITNADRLFTDKEYQQARGEFEKALGLKPAEVYPSAKMKEIDGILAENAKKKALDEDYAATIEEADRQMTEKKYSGAKEKYQSALKLKPQEKYPAERIAEADRALAELARLKEIDDRYNAAIAQADDLLSRKSYPQAKDGFTKASGIKPAESYPKEKIAEIDKILANIAIAKKLDDDYRSVIANADQLFTAKTWDQSLAEYKKARDLKPAETYPGTKITEIEKILADIEAAKILDQNYMASIRQADQLMGAKNYDQARAEFEKASGMKPAEAYPKTKITEIDGLLAEIARKKALDEEYTTTIAQADKLLEEKSLEAARVKYQKATELKSAETYPKTKITEIDKLLADQARLKALEEQYLGAVAEADRLLGEKKYDLARDGYNKALKIKPSEQYPKDKITEIDGLLAAIARQKQIDDQYRVAIVRADQLMDSKSWDQARTEYVNASGLKPEENYPKDRIADVDAILAEIKAKETLYVNTVEGADKLLAEKKYEDARTAYQNALTIKPQATHPKEKIAEINRIQEELLGKQKFYDNLIGDADALLASRDFPKAKDTYQRASGVFPDKSYPKERIALITAKLDSIYKANKSKYDAVIADADRYFRNFEFDKAIDAYTEAAGYLPMENYPNEMIIKIRRIISENAVADVLRSSVTITSNEEKQFTFTPLNQASRKNNFVYIKVKNLTGKPFNVLMRYGKDKKSNGGIVMRNITIDGKVNERLVSVKDQDAWSREDNNWISLIPQGGDIEVSFIQVSRAKLD